MTVPIFERVIHKIVWSNRGNCKLVIVVFYFRMIIICYNLPDSWFLLQDGRETFGRLRGLISRSQLMVLLHNKIYNLTTDGWDNSVINMKMFRASYPVFPKIEVSVVNLF